MLRPAPPCPITAFLVLSTAIGMTGCRKDQPDLSPIPEVQAQEVAPPAPEPEPEPPAEIPRYLPAERLAAEPLGPDPELLQMRPEYHVGQRFRVDVTRHETAIVSVQSDARVAATETESTVRASCVVEIEETDKYEPYVFTVAFDASTTASLDEGSGPSQLSGARWRCGARSGEVTCTDVDSGADFAPPPWLVFFHAGWIPQHTAEADLEWVEEDAAMLGWPSAIESGVHFSVADADAESGAVALHFEVDGATALGFFGGQTFIARGEGELTLDTRERALTGLRYVMDTFIPPTSTGLAPLQQRRARITYDLRVGPAPR